MKAMSDKSGDRFSRRRFLARVSAVGAVAFLGLPRKAVAEPPPEVKKLRLVHTPAICLAPQYLAEALLHAEGFAEVEYVPMQTDPGPDVIAAGLADMSMWDIPGTIPRLDAGKPILMLAGVHAGCYELFGNDRVRAIRDLRGKTIAIYALGGGVHILVSSILAYVGIDPRTDVKWATAPTSAEAMRLFTSGEADAFMGFAPEPQELRAKNIGRVIVDTAQDRPWSQYFCCAVIANRGFVQSHPMATKRALRALLKAADICASDPVRVAGYLAARGFEARYEVGLEVLKALPYNRWRQSDPEDTLRFHALRLHEVGLIKSSPQKLIAQGTDWRFLNELKKELKT